MLDDGQWKAVRCMRFWKDGLTDPSGWRRPFVLGGDGKVTRDHHGDAMKRGADEDGGQVFVRDDGGSYVPRPLSPEEKARIAETKRRDAEYAQRQRENAANKALSIWRKAKPEMPGTAPACTDGSGPNHARARAYFEARGVPLDRLPGGVLPATIRYDGACERERGAAEGAPADTCPAIIGAFASAAPERRVTAVQRIFIDPSGEPRKAPGDPDHVKCSRGSFKLGQAIWLTPPDKQTGVLIVAEGLETAMACLAARGPKGTAAVWCVVSTSGLKALRLSEADVNAAAGGWVKHVVIAADLDRAAKASGKRPGTEAAQACYQHLTERWPDLAVRIATPEHADAPELIDAAGEIIGDGKSVDWLDVLAKGNGADHVARRLLPEVEREPLLLLPPEGTKRAQIVLRRLFGPRGPWAGQAWGIAWFAGEWWVRYSGARPGWRKETTENVAARVRLLLDQYKILSAKQGAKPAALSDRNVRDVLDAVRTYTAVMGNRMPTWLPPAFDAEGRPLWETSIRWHEDGEADRADSLVCFPNGVLDVNAWKAGRVVLKPPTARLFSAACLPWPFPTEIFGEEGEINQERAERLAAAACPEWCGFLSRVFGGDVQRIHALQQFIGYIFSPTNWLEKLCWLQSSPGAGKSTILDVVTALLGFDNVAPIEPHQLGDKFGLGPLVGKMFYPLDEFRIGRHVDSMSVLDRLLKIASGAPQATENKFSRRSEPIVLPGKIMVGTNSSPPLNDPTFAMGRRLLVLPLEQRAGAEDPELKSRLVEGARNIMPWALLGLRSLMQAGRFTQPEAGASLLDDMRRQQSPVHAFCDDLCVVQAGSSVPTDLLWSQWCKWCEEQGKEEGSKETLGRRLSEVYGVKREPLPGLRGKYCWLGVRLRWPGESGRTPADTCIASDQWDAETQPVPRGFWAWPTHTAFGLPPQPPFMEEAPSDSAEGTTSVR